MSTQDDFEPFKGAMRTAMADAGMTGLVQVITRKGSRSGFVGKGKSDLDMVITVTVETWDEWDKRTSESLRT